MRISRGNYIRQKLDDPALAEAFGSEWDTLHAEWHASLPADTEAVNGYLASLPEPWRREQYDPDAHGSREEVEAAAAAWAAEAEAARAAVDAKRLEEEAREAERTESARQEVLQEKAKLREDIEKASNTTALRALMIKALERLGAI